MGKLFRLRRDRRGLALTEFALALPFLTIAIFMGLETAWLVVQRQTVGRIAAQVADNVARVRDSIDESNIHETMIATRLNGERINVLDNGRIIISSVQRNPAGDGQWIRWQRCFGAQPGVSRYGPQGKGQTDRSLPNVGPSGREIVASEGMAIIVVEMKHRYQPLISNRWFGPQEFETETAFVVRQRTDLGINNSARIPAAQLMTC